MQIASVFGTSEDTPSTEIKHTSWLVAQVSEYRTSVSFRPVHQFVAKRYSTLSTVHQVLVSHCACLRQLVVAECMDADADAGINLQ